jgi:hypothetical protein
MADNNPNSPSPVTQDKWSMSDERQFIENLLVQRVNFLILFYSLILGGALNTHKQGHLTIVLFLGTLICGLLTMSIFPLEKKLEILIAEIYNDDNHPAKKIRDQAKQKTESPCLPWAFRGCDRKIIGYWIPLICAMSLLLGFILSLFCINKAFPGSGPPAA